MTVLMVLLMFVPCAILIGLIVLYVRMEKANFDRLQHSFTEAIVSSDGTASEAPAPVSERIDTLPPEYDDDEEFAEESDDEEFAEESDDEDPDENLGEESEELPWD